jgi:glutathionylspermidine synthase
MQRISIPPRAGWQRKVERLGLIWHTAGGQPYWNESACYRFTAGEIDQLEAATAELYRLCLAAGQHVIDHDLFSRFGIPGHLAPLIEQAWEAEPPALNHGRFDLGYDGQSPPKMFEFNCDTPTAMFEAAVAQWHWKEEVFPGEDQFTSLHDKLLAKWRDIAPYLVSRRIHFTHVADAAGEDTLTVTYLRDLAQQAGLDTEPILVQDIGWDARRRRFVDLDERAIDVLFHLYPWEWLVNEEFGPHLVECHGAMQWIEPIWKMMWSNKALLAVLWELFPGHPNLLPAYLEPRGASYVKKPLLAREGANVTLVKDGSEIARTAGDYGHEGYVYQELYDLPDFAGNRPVVGSWIVDGEPAGIGIREGGMVTGNTGCFVPHVFAPR